MSAMLKCHMCCREVRTIYGTKCFDCARLPEREEEADLREQIEQFRDFSHTYRALTED